MSRKKKRTHKPLTSFIEGLVKSSNSTNFDILLSFEGKIYTLPSDLSEILFYHLQNELKTWQV